MPNSDYSSDRFVTRQMECLNGISLAGTSAATADVVRMPISDSVAIDKIRVVARTGGTSAGLTLGFGKSLGGTGAVVLFASSVITTVANNTLLANPTVTSTSFVDGDVLVVQNLAGTVAATPVVDVTIGYKELFINANA